MFGALKPGLRTSGTLKLVVNVVCELLTKNNSTAFRSGDVALYKCVEVDSGN